MNSGRRASRKTPPKKTPPAADRTVAETVNRRLNELRPAERRAARTLLADRPQGSPFFTATLGLSRPIGGEKTSAPPDRAALPTRRVLCAAVAVTSLTWLRLRKARRCRLAPLPQRTTSVSIATAARYSPSSSRADRTWQTNSPSRSGAGTTRSEVEINYPALSIRIRPELHDL